MSPNIHGDHTKKKMRDLPRSKGSRKHTHLFALRFFHLPLDSHHTHRIQIDNICCIRRTTLGQQSSIQITWWRQNAFLIRYQRFGSGIQSREGYFPRVNKDMNQKNKSPTIRTPRKSPCTIPSECIYCIPSATSSI